jgi:hypothetical protein
VTLSFMGSPEHPPFVEAVQHLFIQVLDPHGLRQVCGLEVGHLVRTQLPVLCLGCEGERKGKRREGGFQGPRLAPDDLHQPSNHQSVYITTRAMIYTTYGKPTDIDNLHQPPRLQRRPQRAGGQHLPGQALGVHAPHQPAALELVEHCDVLVAADAHHPDHVGGREVWHPVVALFVPQHQG